MFIKYAEEDGHQTDSVRSVVASFSKLLSRA